MMNLLKDAIGSASRYCFNHPLTVLRLARHAAGLRWAIPLDAIRWLVRQIPGEVAPEDIRIEARPPAIHLAATLDLMGTKVRASATLRVDELRFSADELGIVLDLRDVDVNVLGGPGSPLEQLLQSGAIDLSKPANLMNFLPKRPKFLVGAKDNNFVLDLMQIPEVAENGALHKALATLTPVVNVRAIRTEGDMLLVAFMASPLRVGESLAALRA